MAQLPPVTVPEKTWVNVYSTTGITVGTQLIIQNIGSSDSWLVDSTAEPDENNTGRNIIEPRVYLTTDNTPDGVWAYSFTGTTLQVEEA